MRCTLMYLAWALASPFLMAQQMERVPISETPALLFIREEKQTLSTAQPQTASLPRYGPPSPTSNGPTGVVIPQDMPVELRLAEGLSTLTDHRGYVVHLEVTSDVVADGVVVVPAGTPLTVKLTHAGGRIEFSEPRLVVGGRELRLSKLSSRERGELGAEEVDAIGIAIFAVPVVVITLPIQAVLGVREAIRNHRKHEPKRYVTMEKGQTFAYYVRDRTSVQLAGF